MPHRLPCLAVAVAFIAGAGAGAPALAKTATCTPHVDKQHIIRALGAKAFVKSTKGGVRELVVRGVSPTAARQALEDETRCDIDLERFEQHFRAHPREMHARLGGVAIRVTGFSYDADTGTLRTKGRIEHGPQAARTARSAPAAAAQNVNATMIVYASIFVPFDSSF